MGKEKRKTEKNTDINVEENLKKSSKRRNRAYIMILIGVLLMIAGVWLFSNTFGTRLLFVDVWTGRISKYYWIVCLCAVLILLWGTWQIKRYPQISRSETMNDIGVKEHMEERTVMPDIRQIYCSQCGKSNNAEAKFCIFCGTKMS